MKKLKLIIFMIVLGFVVVACSNQPTPTPTAVPSTQEEFPTAAPAATDVPATEEAAVEEAPTEEPTAPAPVIMIPEPGPDDSFGKSPWWPWLSAHVGNETPPATLTGPITLHGEQAEGGVNFLLPGPRALDPTVFGTADNPMGTELPAMVLGVPPQMRADDGNGGLMTAGPTPFGNDSAAVLGSITLTLVDATATDGIGSQDQVDMVATFMSPNGEDEYRVEVKRAAPFGMFNPTGGGVVTNFIQHGVTGWGTRLMPTLYSYVSFWGMGNIYKNDELIAEGRPVHGMQTEFVRKAPYDLAFDNEVDPDGVHFHLMIPPVTPAGEPDPIPTGFILPNGAEQPFFHVMFPTVQWTTEVNGVNTEQIDLPFNELPASPEMMALAQAEDAPYKQSPWWPWISAHAGNENPPQLLTGPIAVSLSQAEGGAANVLLPGPRQLDPTVFGTADAPKGTDLPPIVLGVPEAMRTEGEDGGLMTAGPTPFSNNFVTVAGSLEASFVDATAMDGARTQDTIDFRATFSSPAGDEYEVIVPNAAPHGWFNPTGGGVVTDFIQHGVTKWGTMLMPTEYSYVSFWGMGNILKNGEVIAEGRLVHGMLTEFVRKAPYDLAFDSEISPNSTHFHLMIPPVDPFGNPNPVPTGWELPNGAEMPFFHVMFPVVEASATPLGATEEAAAADSAGDAAAQDAIVVHETPSNDSNIREIEIVAGDLAFNVQNIEIQKGETVRFIARSTDIFHTFTLKESTDATELLFNLNLFPDADPQVVEVTFNEAGEFYFLCLPHESMGMNGPVIVTDG